METVSAVLFQASLSEAKLHRALLTRISKRRLAQGAADHLSLLGCRLGLRLAMAADSTFGPCRREHIYFEFTTVPRC